MFDTQENSYRNMQNEALSCMHAFKGEKGFKDGYKDLDNDPTTTRNLDTTATFHEIVSKQPSNDLKIDGCSTAH
jgi:hypothetical protein